jgi:hypothetical protein
MVNEPLNVKFDVLLKIKREPTLLIHEKRHCIMLVTAPNQKTHDEKTAFMSQDTTKL